VLRVAGGDAATFLQGQFSNDLGNLKPGEAAYGLWLDRKGHVVADGHVILIGPGEGYWVASVSSPAATVAGRLGDFIIADDVALEDQTGGWLGLSLVGEGTGAWLGSEPRAGIHFKGRRAAAENWEWIHPAEEGGPADAAVARIREASREEMERLRIASGIASVPGDIGPGELPDEGGLEDAAISYSKGCYLGQEVMARLKSRGSVRRKLVRVRGPGAAPAVPAQLWSGEQAAGELRSAVGDGDGLGFVGLALIRVPPAGSFGLERGVPPAVEIVGGW
jgi:hypothetical protein